MTRIGMNIPANATVYCSGAKIFKILPEVSSAWAKILSRVPNSYLVLTPFHPNIAQAPIRPFIKRINTQMSEAGVDFSRIRFLKAMPTRADLQGMMSVCDVYLDSFPYTGACSLTDPLNVGLPTITISGKTLRNNVAAAILRNIGIEETIARNSEEYIEKAVMLGQNPAYRNMIRQKITQTLSCYNPITDTTTSGIKLLAALRDMTDTLRREDTRLTVQPPAVLKQKIQQLISKLSEQKNPHFHYFVGNEILRLLILPYFASGEDNKELHAIDIGSCSAVRQNFFWTRAGVRICSILIPRAKQV
ncbi:MAG: hypothetical protein HC887_00980 [Desulfobacteraceae bacterium]|nr:hypothetical protein [Desulfobacteraceae bacterium]